MEASKLVLLLVLAMAIAMVDPTLAQNLPDDYVSLHNAARAVVGVGPVSWDADVQAYAERYAKKRAAGDCTLVHSGGPYGENIYGGPGGGVRWTAKDAVNAWVAEKPYYDYASNSCTGGKECRHYTQVVWRASTKIGCARAECTNSNGVFITCNYSPPGNYRGRRPY